MARARARARARVRVRVRSGLALGLELGLGLGLGLSFGLGFGLGLGLGSDLVQLGMVHPTFICQIVFFQLRQIGNGNRKTYVKCERRQAKPSQAKTRQTSLD
jgi:hypothetical protein